jgi:hypothetical protein
MLTRAVAALSVALLSGLVVGASSLAAAGPTTCTDTLAPGTYGQVTVPAGAVCIIDSGPVVIRGGLTVGDGATFAFGDEGSPNVNATISGGVRAQNAASVQIHFSTISGGVTLSGGSGPFGGPFGVTFTTLEDNTINGTVTMTGYNGFWQGFFRNTVNGTVNFNGNTVTDPDGNEVQTNTIHGNLNCSGNTPAPQVGDSGGSPNSVTGAKTGQCTAV